MKTLSKILLAVWLLGAVDANAELKTTTQSSLQEFEKLQKKYHKINNEWEDLMVDMSNENGRVEKDVHEVWSQIGNLHNPIWENQITLSYQKVIKEEEINNENLIRNHNDYKKENIRRLTVVLKLSEIFLRQYRVKIQNTAVVIVINEYLKLIDEFNEWCTKNKDVALSYKPPK
jgi:hypothetical protein